jgi:hypothetical protein
VRCRGRRRRQGPDEGAGGGGERKRHSGRTGTRKRADVPGERARKMRDIEEESRESDGTVYYTTPGALTLESKGEFNYAVDAYT